MGKSHQKIGQKPSEKEVKAIRKLGESHQKIRRTPSESHLTSTVMNTENGRCGMTFSMLFHDFDMLFAEHSQGF